MQRTVNTFSSSQPPCEIYLSYSHFMQEKLRTNSLFKAAQMGSKEERTGTIILHCVVLTSYSHSRHYWWVFTATLDRTTSFPKEVINFHGDIYALLPSLPLRTAKLCHDRYKPGLGIAVG